MPSRDPFDDTRLRRKPFTPPLPVGGARKPARKQTQPAPLGHVPGAYTPPPQPTIQQPTLEAGKTQRTYRVIHGTGKGAVLTTEQATEPPTGAVAQLHNGQWIAIPQKPQQYDPVAGLNPAGQQEAARQRKENLGTTAIVARGAATAAAGLIPFSQTLPELVHTGKLDKTGLALDATFFVPGGPRGAVAFIKALREGKEVADAVRVGVDAARTSTAAIHTAAAEAKAVREEARQAKLVKSVQPHLDESLPRTAVHEQIDRSVPDPAEAQVVKDQLDRAAAKAATDGKRAERADNVDAYYRRVHGQMNVARGAPLEPRANPFVHSGPTVAENQIRRTAVDRLPEMPRANKRVVDNNGIPTTGQITPEEVLQRIELATPDKAQRAADAAFYQDVHTVMDVAFNDTEVMAWLASQRAAAPSRGITDLMRVLDHLHAGTEFPKTGPGSIGVAAKTMQRLLKGETGLSEGARAKISDFIDAALHKKTRAWMGDDPRFGGPAVVDRWGYRSWGFVDGEWKKLNPHLTQDVINDNTYEFIARRYQELADLMNAKNFDGRSDWTVHEVQAMDWAAVQRYVGEKPEGMRYAFDVNARTLQTAAPAEDLTAALERHNIRTVEEPVTDNHGRTSVRVIGSPDAYKAISQELADQHGQVWLMRDAGEAAVKTQLTLPAMDENFVDEAEKIGFTHIRELPDGSVEIFTPKGGIRQVKIDALVKGATDEGKTVGTRKIELEVVHGRAGARGHDDLSAAADDQRVAGAEAEGAAGGAPSAAGSAGDRGRGLDLHGSRVPAQEFLDAQARNSRAWNLSEYDAAQLVDHATFLSPDGEAGYMVSPTGELGNVFNNPDGIRGQGATLIGEAVEQHGARYLNAYEPHLPTRYRRFGFAEVGRVKFDPKYAPAGMPPEEIAKKPDVVFMALDAVERPGRYFDSYEEAQAVAEKAGKARSEFPVSGTISGGAPERGEAAAHRARYIQSGDLTVQVFQPRSAISRAGLRITDNASRQVTKLPHVADFPGVRLLTMPERTAKFGGRTVRVERDRTLSRFARQVNAIGDVKEGSAEDVANYWYAQLDPAFRNENGLGLIRDKQAEKLDHIETGGELDDLQRRQAALNAQLRGEPLEDAGPDIEPGVIVEAADRQNIGRVTAIHGDGTATVHFVNKQEGTEAHVNFPIDELTSSGKRVIPGAEPDTDQIFAAMRELMDVNRLIARMPEREQSLTNSIALLDQLIANPPAVNEEAINAVRDLMSNRAKILVEAGRLNPERAAERPGLVSRWLGLEPTGEEVYLGHRLPKTKRGGHYPTPSGGVGRVASPQGMSPNQLVLATYGELRPSLHVALEDWGGAQTFAMNLQARNDLARMGKPFDYTKGVPKGYVLVNPKGHVIPPTWRNDELAQFTEGYEDMDGIREQAEQIIRGYVATNPDAHNAMIDAAIKAQMKTEDLRVVPERLVNRYYSQFRTTVGRMPVYDSMVDAAATSIVFGRIGYVPKNIAQNMILSVPHQGAFFPVNAVRTAQLYKADKELFDWIAGEIGQGATGALGNEAYSQKLLGGVARFVGGAADTPFRVTAFLHEAAAQGVISSTNPFLTAKDIAALRRLMHPNERPLLNDIREAGVNAMGDFSRMTPDQSRKARRFLVIPGWLMAGTRYPIHFALTHPIRSALLAYIGMGAPGTPAGVFFGHKPKPADEYFTGSSYREGIQIPEGVPLVGGKRARTSSLSPISTPEELILAAKGSIQGKTGPFDYTTPTIFDMAQPVIGAGVSIAQGEGVGKSLKRLAPNVSFIQGMISPKASSTYPQDVTRGGRLAREFGVIPIRVNDPAAKLSVFQQQLVKAGVLPEGTKTLKQDELEFDAAKAYARSIGMKTLPAEVATGLAWRTALQQQEKEAAKDVPGHTLTAEQKAELVAQAFVRLHPDSVTDVNAGLAEAKQESANLGIDTPLDDFRNEVYGEAMGDYNDFHGEMLDWLEGQIVTRHQKATSGGG